MRGEIGFAGEPEDPGDAIDEEAGAERAEDEIFHAGFERGGLPPHVGDQHVEADRDQFQRDEDEQEIDGRRHEHQARAGEDRQAVEFADARARRARRE